MASIQQVKVNNTYYQLTVPLVECTTAASTAAKIASFAGIALDSGTMILLKLTNGNSAASPTLNLNSLGAKSILGDGACKPAQFSWTNAVMRLTYDGTNWIIIG